MFKKRILVLLTILTLMALTFITSCNNQNFPISTESGIDRLSEIRFALRLNSLVEKGVSFENILVEAGQLENSASNPYSNREYEAGDKCLLLSGNIKNETDQDLIVGMFANGYNQYLEIVSWTLSAARIEGQDDFDVPANSNCSFELFQSWAEDILYFEIGAQTFTQDEYYQN